MQTEPVVIGAKRSESGAGALVLACGVVVLLAACELGEDTRYCLNRPVISGFEIAPEEISTSARDTVTFGIVASDVSGVGVTVDRPTGLQESCYADALVAGLGRCKVVLPQPHELGTWVVTQVFLNDTGVGEFCTGTTVTGAQLETAGYPTSFLVRD